MLSLRLEPVITSFELSMPKMLRLSADDQLVNCQSAAEKLEAWWTSTVCPRPSIPVTWKAVEISPVPN